MLVSTSPAIINSVAIATSAFPSIPVAACYSETNLVEEKKITIGTTGVVWNSTSHFLFPPLFPSFPSVPNRSAAPIRICSTIFTPTLSPQAAMNR